MSDLRYILDDWAPDMEGWTCRITVDDDGNWWLIQSGKRRTFSRWRPADENEAFAVVTVLYMLNEAGEVPLPGKMANLRKSDQAALRRNFKTQGYGLLLRHLLR